MRIRGGRFIALLPDDLQGGFAVVATAGGVDRFKAGWPCSRLPNGPVRFEFAGNGDLVDVSTGYDGADLLALSQDAQEFGEVAMEKRRKAKERDRAWRKEIEAHG